ncbi:hypothetical protein [Mycetocola spongiae]|uniref:hypothetical protein n=1 Tax=Mycetocola spongiae TaxID=2859226 RepID=UPI001CF1443F|nr:hypothetical protein [Mycetocola spongiae]UCR90373.1 hypothetical protein KXZ72_06930 [Mycetocola spongiae]
MVSRSSAEGILAEYAHGTAWTAPNLTQLENALEKARTDLERISTELLAGWTGEAADQAREIAIPKLRQKLYALEQMSDIARKRIKRDDAERAAMAAGALKSLPSAEVPQSWLRSLAEGATIVIPALGPITETGLSVVGAHLAGERAKAAQEALDRIDNQIRARANELPKRAAIKPLPDLDFPGPAAVGPNFPGPGKLGGGPGGGWGSGSGVGGGSLGSPVLPGMVPGAGAGAGAGAGSGAGRAPAGSGSGNGSGNGSGDRDGYNPGGEWSGGRVPGGSGGGLMPGLPESRPGGGSLPEFGGGSYQPGRGPSVDSGMSGIGGSGSADGLAGGLRGGVMGAAGLAAGSKLAGGGLIAGAGGLLGGAGAGGAGLAGGPGGAGAGGAGAGGMAGSSSAGAAAGKAGGAAGSGGSSSGGARPGGMMGGQGGAPAEKKNSKSGGGGYLAPKFEEAAERGPAALASRAGSRKKKEDRS